MLRQSTATPHRVVPEVDPASSAEDAIELALFALCGHEMKVLPGTVESVEMTMEEGSFTRRVRFEKRPLVGNGITVEFTGIVAVHGGGNWDYPYEPMRFTVGSSKYVACFTSNRHDLGRVYVTEDPQIPWPNVWRYCTYMERICGTREINSDMGRTIWPHLESR